MDRFDWDLHRSIADLGVFGLLAGKEHNPLPEEDFVAVGLVVEELAYADFNMANAAIPVMLMSSLLAQHGSPRVKDEYLPRLVDGTIYVALGLTEPDCGSDVSAITTTATATRDGYVISGEKTSVTMHAEAEAIFLVARTVRDGQDVGASAFLVPLDAQGISTARIEDPGWKPLVRGILRLDQVSVPRDALLGQEGVAFRQVLNGFDFTRPLLALTGIGCAQVSIDETVEYVSQRKSFGS